MSVSITSGGGLEDVISARSATTGYQISSSSVVTAACKPATAAAATVCDVAYWSLRGFQHQIGRFRHLVEVRGALIYIQVKGLWATVLRKLDRGCEAR